MLARMKFSPYGRLVTLDVRRCEPDHIQHVHIIAAATPPRLRREPACPRAGWLLGGLQKNGPGGPHEESKSGPLSQWVL
jgi:hypothetical protein